MHARLRSVVVFIVVALALSTACKRREAAAKKYVASATPAAKESLDSMKAILQQALALPPLATDGSYSGPPITADYEDASVLAIGFDVPTKLQGTTINVMDSWGHIQDAVKGDTTWYSTVEAAKLDFEALAAVKYVFMLKTTHREDPVITDSTSSRGSFSPGNVAAEAHLFALDASRRYLGGFRFHSTNSESMTVSAKRDQMHNSAKGQAFDDLSEQTRKAFLDGVKRFGGGNVTATH